MKKKLFYLAALICCVATSLAFTSCGDDEPDVTATAHYSIIFDDDFFQAVGSVVIFYKDNGEVKFESITSGTTSWVKDVTGKLPNEFGFQWRFQPKDEADLTEDVYNVFATASISIRTNNSSANHESGIGKMAIQKKDVISTIKKASGNSLGYKVDKKGNAIPNDNLNYDM